MLEDNNEVEVTEELVRQHLTKLDKAKYVVLPKEVKGEWEECYDGTDIEYDKPYKFNVLLGEDYHYLTLQGMFGYDDDGYCTTEVEDFSDEAILKFQPANEDQCSLMEGFEGLVKAVSEAAKAANEYSNENKLGESVEWSADAGTIAEWNSSRC